MSRTKTYIAADWDNDRKVVDQLYSWKESKYWDLNFTDAHDITQARDTSLPCSIKRSLHERLEASRTFVLIVGDHTANLTKGSCQFCDSYNSYTQHCARGYSVSYDSFVEYECKYAVENKLKIVVIYNGYFVNKDRCPLVIRWRGTHIPAYKYSTYGAEWNYDEIKNAIMY